MKESGEKRSRGKLRRAVIGAGVLALALVGYSEARAYFLGRELVRANPDVIAADATLTAFGNALGRSAYSANCASCHGADMKGSREKGTPDLTDDVWLYDFGRVSDIERTVLYGIRSGDARSHNVTDMPALGLQKQLTPDDIKDVIAFVRLLRKEPADPAAAMRGDRSFRTKASVMTVTGATRPEFRLRCAEPRRAVAVWRRRRDDLQSTMTAGNGKCPAWIDLELPTIRALAVYLHSMSKVEDSATGPRRR
jgi:cbb3-type cytochrome c oxidase subunit III